MSTDARMARAGVKSRRVAVAMSGGVDSSVAAAALIEQGYDVVGLTMQVLPGERPKGVASDVRGCCGPDALDSARRVARDLGIPHHVLDLREQFERLVIEPFCEEYARGRTPNPCIWCNMLVKFGPLLRRALEMGASFLATGHYARVQYDEGQNRHALLVGVDRDKDQSYSLWGLSQEQLAHALFPLGEMRKAETRAKAAELGLSVAERPESQEICFLAEESCGEYVGRRRPEAAQPGPIVNRAGRQLGRHAGIACYTIGQRQGLRIAHERPLYVVGIDAQQNRLMVGEESEVYTQDLLIGDVNYVSIPELPRTGARFRARIRHAAPMVDCRAYRDGAGARVEFAEPQRAVSPGQAAVCYEGEAVALGGIIEDAL